MSVVEFESTPNRTLQRYYPWVVIGIAFLTVGVAFGMRNAFAVFLIAVIEEFHWSRGLASGALMLGSVMWILAAPVIGILLDRLGPREGLRFDYRRHRAVYRRRSGNRAWAGRHDS